MDQNEMNQYNGNSQQEEQYDEVDIMELVRKVLKEWKLLLKWACGAIVVGLIVGFSIPNEYSASALMAPERTGGSSGGGNLSALASLAGINLSSGSGPDALTPDIYPEIVNSTPFLTDLFSLEVSFKHKKETITTDYYEYLKEYNKAPWWNAVISFPMKALGWTMSLFKEKKEKLEGYADLNPYELTDEQAGILKAIKESISVSVDKKTSMITISATAQDPHVAAQLCNVLVGKIQDYVTAYRTDKAREDLKYAEQLYEETKNDYYKAQQRYAKYVDANQGVVFQSIRTESERLQNEMNLCYQLYNTGAQQLQVAKANLQKETPVCTVLQPPSVPLKKSNASKLNILLICIFLGVAVAAVWVLWGRDTWASFKTGLKDSDE